jgi:hypothetical protein
MEQDIVFKMAQKLVGVIKPLMDQSLKSMEVDVKKDSKTYYRISRDLFRAVVVCAAQRMMEDGANQKLVFQTIGEHVDAISRDSWRLFLSTRPELAKKVAAEKDTKDKAAASQVKGFKKANPLKCLPGGLLELPVTVAASKVPYCDGEPFEDPPKIGGTITPLKDLSDLGCTCGKGDFDENGVCGCEKEDPEDLAANSDDPGCQGVNCNGCLECEPGCQGEDCSGCAECKGH